MKPVATPVPKEKNRAAQQVIERGNIAKNFVAQKFEFFVRLTFRGLLYRSQAIAQQAGARIPLVQQGKRREDRGSYYHKRKDGDQYFHEG